jgi:hypothetical protein
MHSGAVKADLLEISQSTLTVAQANVWWYIDGPVVETLLVKWSGTCTLVLLGIMLTLEFC